VLVAEDDEDVRAPLVAYLTAQGHSAVAVSSGAEAVELFAAGAFDLVLTDRAMPGMSGDKVAKTVRRLAPDLLCAEITREMWEGSDLSQAAIEVRESMNLKPTTPIKIDNGNINNSDNLNGENRVLVFAASSIPKKHRIAPKNRTDKNSTPGPAIRKVQPISACVGPVHPGKNEHRMINNSLM